MNLKDTRLHYGLTQIEAASIVEVPLRTYRRYESDNNYGSTFKRKAFIELINEKCEVTENKGILTIEKIKEEVTKLFDSQHKDEVKYCYLFGSYARGEATGKSDIDILVVIPPIGMKYYGIAVDLEERLNKKIDLHTHRQLLESEPFLEQVLKDGIKIYG